MALSMYLNTSSIIAGHPEKNLTYARTCITFIKFHIDLRDKARSRVMIICATTTVFVALSILCLVVYSTWTAPFPGSIFGKVCSILVPGSIGKPFSSLEKKEPSTIVVIRMSFYKPIDT